MSTWVLLRGLTRDSRHWGGFVACLQTAFPGERVLPLDLPGNGALHTDNSPLQIAGSTEHCRAQLHAAGTMPPFRLLAMSLGAMVAVDWMTCFPDEIECAVLINTSLRGISPFYRRLRPGNYPAMLKLAALGGRGAERSILRITTRHPPQAEQTLQDWRQYRRERPVSVRNALRQLIAAARFRAPSAAPSCPVLVLAAPHDRLVDARCSHDLARRWACDIALHPSAGHDIPLDDAEWVASTVRDWLGRRRFGRRPAI